MPVLAAILATLLVSADISGPKPAPLLLTQPLKDKNFYLLSLIHRDRAVEEAIASDTALASISQGRRSALQRAFDLTGKKGSAGLSEALIGAQEISDVSSALGRLCDSSPTIQKFVQGPLRQSGAYQRYADQSDRQLLMSAWLDCSKGLNSVIAVYGTQTSGARSTEIDSPLYTPKNPLYGMMSHALVGVVQDDPEHLKLFFDPNLELAAHLLDAQLRFEAGRHEPMEETVNRAAYRQVAKTHFADYPYSVIVVPGEGPEESNVALSPIGKLRIELAVHRYRAHKAPFILVSGGYVHPSMTPYSEALEMKASLIRDFKVPESAIIVDPHARHTTTNLRNAARLIFRYGLPFAKPGLIVSDPYQSAYIDSASLFNRCQSVFGFQPTGQYKRLGPYDVEFTPNLVSLSIDPSDPLDP